MFFQSIGLESVGPSHPKSRPKIRPKIWLAAFDSLMISFRMVQKNFRFNLKKFRSVQKIFQSVLKWIIRKRKGANQNLGRT